MLIMLGRLWAADAHDAGSVWGCRATCRAADAHDAGAFGAAGQHAGQLMLMMLGRLGLQGNMQGG